MESEAISKNIPRNSTINSASSSASSATTSSVQNTITPAKSVNFTFVHLGRNGGTITFHATSLAERQAWMEAIQNQRNLLVDSSKKFELQLLNDNLFKISNRVNCSVSYAGMLIVGTDDGLYVGLENWVNYDFSSLPSQPFKKIIDEERITQVDVLPDYDMLIFLAGKNWQFD
jgi:hypothetical protein